MTRYAAIALVLTLSSAFAGCATSADDVDVVTASLEDQYFELTEIRGDDGFIDVEVYYAVGQSEEIANEHFQWPAIEPVPQDLIDRLRTVDPDILATATPVAGDLEEPTVDLGAAWPRILQQVRLAQGFHVDRVDLCAQSGLRDCEAEAN